MTTVNPQDPYRSVLVPASAGSGKTYQLARRFLALVASGTSPGAIITVTFTIKAAGEMQSRILAEAGTLLASPKAAASFAADMAEFHRDAERRLGRRLPPPRTPEATAHAILSSTQALKITTIDALFLEWVAKFPAEAAVSAEAPLTLFDPAREKEWDELAFHAVARHVSASLAKGESTPALKRLLKLGFHDAKAKLAALSRHETFLWQAERHSGEAPFRLHAHDAELAMLTDRDLVERLAGDLTRVVDGVLVRADMIERCHAAIAARDLDALFDEKLLGRTRSAVNGQYLRSEKKRDAVAAEVTRIDTTLRAALDARKLSGLNAMGDAYYRLFDAFRAGRDELKQRAGGVEFRDLAKGCHHLLHDDAGLGVRFLLARTVRHVLLDEFQDTSRLQWSIFAGLGSLILEDAAALDDGDAGGAPPSLFLVGDAKQSIYGFREADPSVLGDAGARFAERLVEAPLNVSYRTAQVVLDFVNRTFAGGTLAGFTPHATAAPHGTPFVPDHGRVVVAPLVGDDAEAGKRGAEREAELVADVLAEALAGELPSPVYDKELKRFRPLRPADCAVLYRATTNADAIDAALRARGIPCQREEPRGFFARSEVSDAISLLRFLAWPADVVSLLTVLRSPLGRLTDDEMLAVLEETRGDRNERCAAILRVLGARAPALAKTLTSRLGRRASALPHALLAGALAELDADAAYGDAQYAAPHASMLARSNLGRLVELVLELEQTSGGSLVRIVRRLEQLARDDETGNAPTGGDAVTLMTVHKAKGLEFPLVVLTDTGRSWAKRDAHWATVPAADSLYYVGTGDDQPAEDPAFAALLAAGEKDLTDEAQRLLYVALTRARQYLVVTGHHAEKSGGLPGAIVHPQLAAAMESLAASAAAAAAVSSSVLGGQQIHTYARAAAAADAAVAATPTRPELPPLAVTPDPSLPAGLRNLAPSRREAHGARTGQIFVKEDTSLSRLDARRIGDLVHAAAEAHVLGEAFDTAAAWRRLTRTPPVGPAYGQALAQISLLRASERLRTLLATAIRVEPELPVIHRTKAGMVRGTIDLLVTGADGRHLVVDFKTTAFLAGDAEPDDADLALFAEGRGYGEQLEVYAAAVKKLYGGAAKVRKALFFTALDRLVEI